jgi:hypothetical protein
MLRAAPWIVYFLLAFGLSLFGVIDCARAVDELPSVLVIRFEPGAESLDQGAIRYAVERELGVTVSTQGSADAATLWVAIGPQGALTLRYQPERSILARTVPLSGADAAPALVARLAGNLVRDQAGVLVAQLEPTAAAPVPPASARPSPPSRPAQAPAAEAQPARAREDWLFSALVGVAFGRGKGATLTLAQTRRLGRFDVSLGVDLGAARVPADLFIHRGGYEHVEVTALELTLWGGLDVRVLGGADAQLQLGALAGFRMAGVKVPGNLSGSEGDFVFAPRISAFFRLVGRHGVLLRSTFFVTPREHHVSSSARIPGGGWENGVVRTRTFPVAVQIGYQVSF